VPSRNKIVMFGGQNGNAVGTDTWEFDGTWSPYVRLRSPPGRTEATLTYDPTLDVAVLVGGMSAEGVRLADVWELDALGRWIERNPEVSPPGPRQSTMTYDAARGELVMFGGLVGHNLSPLDTWRFDGSLWTRAAPATEPPKRFYHATTFDAVRSRVVVFGGTNGGAVHLGDTWEWDGTNWSAGAAGGPSERALPALADFTGNSIVLFGGGLLHNGDVYGDTWLYDGTTWTEVTSQPSPPAALDATMAYDPIGERAVLFDGTGQTWELTTAGWRMVAATSSPPPRSNASMVFDPWRGRIVLYGGTAGGQAVNDIWELDGERWIFVPLFGAQPPARQHRSFGPLPAQRALVMYGGRGRADTWLLRYTSDTPDELCDDGLDNDGDRRIDADDPDCGPSSSPRSPTHSSTISGGRTRFAAELRLDRSRPPGE
jgi:hypothetical protein